MEGIESNRFFTWLSGTEYPTQAQLRSNLGLQSLVPKKPTALATQTLKCADQQSPLVNR